MLQSVSRAVHVLERLKVRLYKKLKYQTILSGKICIDIHNLPTTLAGNKYLVGFIVLREIILKGSILYDHLQIQLNALSLSHLTPSVIQPFRLAQILRGIKDNLPPLLKLPFDIETKIRQYYQYTSCSEFLFLSTKQVLHLSFSPRFCKDNL